MPIGLAFWSLRDARTAAAAVVLVATWLASSPVARAQNASCTPVMARLVSLQGSVELRSAGKGQWEKVTRLDTPLCRGDLLRTGPNSRAALFIPSENLLRVDQNSIVSVHVEGDETVVEFFIDESTPRNACGAGYAISRFPRKFKVNTPFSYAAVEGTEFAVALACTQATVSVFEGKVSVQQRTERASKALLESGQTTTVGPGQPPLVQVLVKPTDAVQWALFYPPISDPQFGADPLYAPCESLTGDKRAACLLERAEALLRAGQVNESRADIAALTVQEPNNGDALALHAVILVAKNERTKALRLALEATAHSPDTSRPWLALSYAQQAAFDLQKALHSARKAAAVAPDSALAHARVAELLMSLGRFQEAELAARRAVEADPKQSRGYVILGFVQLAWLDTKKARRTFERAIELDSTDPLPRLGLALAVIREGSLAEGRQQIEIAVGLDPSNSLLRSYLGKAYYEENTKERDALAASQYARAKELDPNDPTPWFYEAILRQSQNRPVEAIESFQESIELNDQRAVFRSRLLLDEDAASRTAELARAYRDISFDRLASLQAALALTTDPGNAGAHRFLADAYSGTPGLSTAAESEFMQSRLRQPLGLRPPDVLRPQSSLSPLVWRPGPQLATGTARASIYDLNPLFASNGATVHLDGLVGTLGTNAQQLAASGLQGNVSLAFGLGHLQTDLTQGATDVSQQGFDGALQVQAAPGVVGLAEVYRSQITRTDVLLPFDPTSSLKLLSDDTLTRARVGFRLGPSPSLNVVLVGTFQERTDRLTFLDFDFSDTLEQSASLGEAQVQLHYPGIGLLAGLAYSDTETTLGSGAPPLTSIQNQAYAYATLGSLSSKLAVILGVSWDHISRKDEDFDREESNPKFGFVWQPRSGTIVRGAAFQYVKRELIAAQSLEPTQIAGFNQVFDDPNGSVGKRYGLAIDQTFRPGWYGGIEGSTREVRVPTLGVTPIEESQWDENEARAYLYAARSVRSSTYGESHWEWAAGVEGQYRNLERPEDAPGPQGIVSLETRRLLTNLTINRGSFSFRISPTYVDQTGTLQAGAGADRFSADDQFWVTDLALTYWLPRRLGLVTAGVSNLFDVRSTIGDLDPLGPVYSPERLLYARVLLRF